MSGPNRLCWSYQFANLTPNKDSLDITSSFLHGYENTQGQTNSDVESFQKAYAILGQLQQAPNLAQLYENGKGLKKKNSKAASKNLPIYMRTLTHFSAKPGESLPRKCKKWNIPKFNDYLTTLAEHFCRGENGLPKLDTDSKCFSKTNCPCEEGEERKCTVYKSVLRYIDHEANEFAAKEAERIRKENAIEAEANREMWICQETLRAVIQRQCQKQPEKKTTK